MTKDRLSQIITELHAKELDLRVAGQAEYAGGEDAFGNFARLATELGISREKVLWVYAVKHKDGIASALNGHTSQREDVRGRILDLRLYLAILYAMLSESPGAAQKGLQVGSTVKIAGEASINYRSEGIVQSSGDQRALVRFPDGSQRWYYLAELDPVP